MKKNPALWVFLCLESLFFVFFVACDLMGKEILFSSTVWKFSVVVLALLYVGAEFLLTKRGDKLFCRRLFLLFAMGLTLVSDVFLLVLDAHYVIGVCTFFFAQLFHALEIPRNQKRALISFSLRLGVTAIALMILGFTGSLDLLSAAVAFYAPELLFNLVEHLVGVFQNRGEERTRSAILAVGFFLFFLCDLCVGLSNVGFSGASIWIFYAPSQALISISSGRFFHENESD